MYGTDRWEKLGLIFQPGKADWMASHIQNPFPELLGNGLYRIHFAARDKDNRARGGCFVFHPSQPSRILDVSLVPTLDVGTLGAFDDCGVMPGSIVECGGRHFMYYTGWSKAVEVPFSFHVGLAISEDGGRTYQRASLAPVLGRNQHDPYITGAPYVFWDNGLFRMWYTSATKWVRENDAEKPKHYYTVKYAESVDGVEWKTSDHLCIEYDQGEYAIARPVVWRTSEGYHMWFTFRSSSATYRIGIADSSNGIDWIRRKSPLGIDISMNGWDSEMICYAHPVFCDGRIYALYNGSGYGETGVGLAVKTA